MEMRGTEYRLDTGQRRQAVAQRARIGKRCRRDLRQTVRSEQRHVDRRRRHQQTLIRADVRLGLGATDVLLERLQRSEEQTSELQSLMRISYAGFCLTKKKKKPVV